MVKFVRNIISKLRMKIKLERMDAFWRYMGQQCFGGYPPSFYYTHTKEEIERITKEDNEELRKLIDQL